MSKQIPGITYPPPTGDVGVDNAIRNIYDNLFYLKRLGETSPVAVTDGGTGATTAAQALSNLGAAKASGIKAGSVALAKITGGGTNGSISWDDGGVISSFVAPT